VTYEYHDHIAVEIPETVARRMDERELVGELGLMQWGKGRRR